MKTEDIDGKTIEHWTPQEVADGLSRREIVVIDVRTPPEFMMEHIAGALLAPLAFIDAAALPTQDGKRIVFHCGSGIRSRKVADMCLAAGYDRIAHLEGGFGAWKQAGMAYIATDPATGGPKPVPARQT